MNTVFCTGTIGTPGHSQLNQSLRTGCLSQRCPILSRLHGEVSHCVPLLDRHCPVNYAPQVADFFTTVPVSRLSRYRKRIAALNVRYGT